MIKQWSLDLVQVTEAAAKACFLWIGKGERKQADQAAVLAMRHAFEELPFRGTVVIGEGERDEAPMLYIGEQVGQGWKQQRGIEMDIAVDPLEGTNLCATDSPGAMAVLAVAPRGGLLHAPDTYMNKLAVGPQAAGAIDLQQGTSWNLHAIAEAKCCRVEELTVVVLDRERHRALIAEIRRAGARVRLIGDGDVGAALALTQADSGVDVLMGSGGAPEGVLAAVALRALGGDFQGQLQFRNPEEQHRAEGMGTVAEKVYLLHELVREDACFVATAVTDCGFGKGVRGRGENLHCESMVLGREGTHVFQMKLSRGW